MFRCHANPAILRQIGRVGAEVSKKKRLKKAKKGQRHFSSKALKYRIVSGYLKQGPITKRVACYEWNWRLAIIWGLQGVGYSALRGSRTHPRVQGSIGGCPHRVMQKLEFFWCHANPSISWRIGRVGAEVSKKKRLKKAKNTKRFQ